jgi:hypothetical protein
MDNIFRKWDFERYVILPRGVIRQYKGTETLLILEKTGEAYIP